MLVFLPGGTLNKSLKIFIQCSNYRLHQIDDVLGRFLETDDRTGVITVQSYGMSRDLCVDFILWYRFVH